MLFDPNSPSPSLMESDNENPKNQLAEVFQITYFLINEKLKQNDSFWKPFLDSLPDSNDTLCTISLETKVTDNTLLIDEIQD